MTQEKMIANKDTIVLTGIKPTGIPHLGNYLGAIKPALDLSEGKKGVFFIADGHALTSVHDAKAMKESVYQVAATWLALGLDPDKCIFFRQTDVPEIFELNWILSCLTPKGFMNRAHAYKDKMNKNKADGADLDSGVNMGLFGYPCLMDADILAFGTHKVPVGKDQKQHVEFARDVAEKFNKTFGVQALEVPEPIICEDGEVITGMDGRKMSKSYDNVLEIFLPSKKLKKKVNKIKTNSQEIEEVKDPDTCAVFSLYKHFTSQEQQDELAASYKAGGMGWGFAKNALFEVLDVRFDESRARYYELLENPKEIDALLEKGAERARETINARINKVRNAVGFSVKKNKN